ncbi:MAG TPA: PEGA domain-containing protein, partial [Polyangiaceae bacterium]|nr:PEGA domain-containing protein [Polyangiaceae bacterium]
FALEGHDPKEVEVNVATGEKAEQKVGLTAEPTELPPANLPPPEPTPAPAPEEPAPPPEPRSKVPAYVTLGVAGAGAVVGTIFGLKALSAKSDYDDAPTSDRADDVERNALIADMAFGVAITLGVTGVVLLTSSDSSAPASDSARRILPRQAKLNVAPYVNQYGGGAAARLRF